jgi:hypothetical protein
MKAKITPTILLIVLVGLSFIVSAASAKGIFVNWAFAVNKGNVPVILHVKTGENKYSEILLEPGQKMVLPAGSQKVTAFPAKGWLDEGDQMKVVTNLFSEDFWRPSKSITEPGKSVKFARPSVAVTPEMRKDMKDDVVFAPGALAEVEEKEEAPIDDRERLLEQNEMYMEKQKRLEEIDPNGAEAEAIKDALKNWKEDLERMTKQAEAKYGTDWREHYRDSNGKLPGGFIEDDKSRLAKIQEKRKEQQNKVDGLRSEFEELKKQLKPVEPRWEDRLIKDQREFREKFIEEHGPPSTWDEETRKKYEEGFNELTKKSKEQWEKDKAEQSEINRAIGRKIKEIAQEQVELNSLDKEAKQLEARQKAKDEKLLKEAETEPLEKEDEVATLAPEERKGMEGKPEEETRVGTECNYVNDFEGEVGPEWSKTSTDKTPRGNRRFLGQFGNETITLTLQAPNAGTASLAFDLYLANSWDGNNDGYGPDRWKLSVSGGPILLDTSFSNLDEYDWNQSYPGAFGQADHPPGTGAAEYDSLGYSYYGDSVYHLTFTFQHGGGDVVIAFSAEGLQGVGDESWGLDNVEVQGACVIKEDKTTTEDDTFTLHVMTKTAAKEVDDKAKMDDSNVYIRINGDEKYSQELNTNKNDFEFGALDIFDCNYELPLDQVKTLELYFDGNDEWLCETIAFQFRKGDKTSKYYTYNIDQWFSGKEADKEPLWALERMVFEVGPVSISRE